MGVRIGEASAIENVVGPLTIIFVTETLLLFVTVHAVSVAGKTTVSTDFGHSATALPPTLQLPVDSQRPSFAAPVHVNSAAARAAKTVTEPVSWFVSNVIAVVVNFNIATVNARIENNLAF